VNFIFSSKRIFITQIFYGFLCQNCVTAKFTVLARKPGNFSLWGFLKLTRFPNLLIIVFTQYFTAIFLIMPQGQWQTVLKDPKIFLLSLTTAFIAAAGYYINDYYDVKIDFVNKPNRVVVDKVLKRRTVMMAHTVLNFLGIFLAVFVSLKVMVINFLSAVLLWFYSNQLKRMPFIGNMAVALLTGTALMVVSIYYERAYFPVFIYSIFAFSISLIREIVKDIEDVKGDMAFGCRTLPVVLGIRRTKMIIYLLSGVFVALLFYLASLLKNDRLTWYFLLLIPLFAYFIYRLIRADTIKDFTFLSNYCKMMMLTGILSMVFFS